jgi:YggT family protein
MRRSQKNGIRRIDDHDQPTEPINMSVSPSAPTATSDNPGAPNMSVPYGGRPFPQQQVSPQPPLIGAYPFLPPPPARKKAGVNEFSPLQPANADAPTRARVKRRRLFPLFVGLIFVAVQMVLLVRILLQLIGIWDGVSWVNTFYALTSVLIWPVQILLQQIHLPLTSSIEISTLLAILLYGMLSRILVRVLKLIFRSR